MPSKKKKYNARFPAGRIKKIMQTDEEVGKVAQAVPVIISRTLELFVESLLTKSAQITQARNAKTLTPSHMKQCILSESRFDFLKDLVKNIPDATTQEDNEVPLDLADYASGSEAQIPPVIPPSPAPSSPRTPSFAPNFYTEQQGSSSQINPNSKPTTVIQYGAGPKTDSPKIDFSIKSLVNTAESTDDEQPEEPKIHIDLTNIIRQPCQDVPPLIPLARNSLYQGNNDNLCIDEDYDT